jgi:hypothetical protein
MMNERIKALAEQCHHRYSEHNIDLEKFAELIVRECVERIYPQWIKEHRHIDPTNLADAVMRVKQHFEVE